MSEHEFVSLGIEAEGEVNEAVFLLGFTDKIAAVLFDECNAFLDVVTLKAEAGPGPFPFATSVDSDGGTAQGDLAPNLHFEGELGTEGLLIELYGAEMVGCPDGIFHF